MKKFLTLTTAAAVLSLASCAQAGPGDVDKAEIEEIVRSYLLENPEILIEMQEALQTKSAELEAQETREAIASLSDQIFRDPRDFSIGPKDAKVQIVEFFDYNCGFCKRSTDWVEDAINENPDDVRFVFKELPVLTGREGMSFTAARAALAAARQGKYRKMHFALMDERALTRDRILEVARQNGINVEQLERDMEDPAITRQIEDTLELGSRIPALTGTPFFIINDEYVSGASMERLNALLEDELS